MMRRKRNQNFPFQDDLCHSFFFWVSYPFSYLWAWLKVTFRFHVVKTVTELPPGSNASVDPLEKEVATHSGILAWKIPWTEEPGGLGSMGSHNRVVPLSCLATKQQQTSCLTESPSTQPLCAITWLISLPSEHPLKRPCPFLPFWEPRHKTHPSRLFLPWGRTPRKEYTFANNKGTWSHFWNVYLMTENLALITEG